MNRMLIKVVSFTLVLVLSLQSLNFASIYALDYITDNSNSQIIATEDVLHAHNTFITQKNS